MKAEGEFPSRSSEAIPVRDAALEMLKSIPGHAEYYKEKINIARDRVEQATLENDSNRGAYVSNVSSYQNLFFRVIHNVPTVETVTVLGSFLHDDRAIDRATEPGTNSLTGELLIEDRPTRHEKYNSQIASEIMAAYRKWFKEIETGKRTFRFIGDPQEYDLKNPAPEKRGAPCGNSRTAKREGVIEIWPPSSRIDADDNGAKLTAPEVGQATLFHRTGNGAGRSWLVVLEK